MPRNNDDIVIKDEEEDRVLKSYFEQLEHSSETNLMDAPAKLLHRSALLLHKQACIYVREGDLQTAYILFLRFCKLALSPNNPMTKPLMDKALVKKALGEMERIKPLLVEAVKREFRKRKLDDTKQKLAVLRKSNASSLLSKSEDSLESLEHSTVNTLIGNSFERKIRMQVRIIEAFRQSALENTQKGIETCAVLGGTLTHNTLHITALILPRQHATPDTCTMTHEEELVQVQDQNDLLILGWIHTHPTQGLFLSSVDLHTHYGFQVLVPEAIAIVIAPSIKSELRDWGVFRIKQMQLIGECRKSGFHPHSLSDDHIYHDVYSEIDWTTESQIQIFDLRKP